MRKIVVLDAKTLGDVPNLNRLSDFGDLVVFQTTTPDKTIANIGDAEIVVTNKVVVDEHIMKNCPKLMLICIAATGMNNVDLKAARAYDIKVKNAVGYSSHSVAQHTFAALFMLYNQIKYYDEYVKSGQYVSSGIFTHYGPVIYELKGKTFGIIGLGNIGKTVARIATAFGATVQYYSTSGKNNNSIFNRTNLNELMRTSDIISIHAPLNENTLNLITSKELALVKQGAILINVGRGGIVNEQDLAVAVDHGKLGGACIDVYEKEPITEDNPLLQVMHPERLVLTPHNAWASLEARIRLLDIVYENIAEFVNSKTQ